MQIEYPMIQDLTRGNSVKLIVLFAIPLLIGNLFQQFYNMADTFIVGRTIGLHALAAVGCTGCLMFLVLGFVFGYSAGLAIVTSQRFGAGDLPGVRKSFAANLVLGLAMTLLLTVGTAFLLRPLLVLMRTPPEILDDAHRYIAVIMYGIGTSMLFNVLSNCLRAVGNSRAPLVFLVIACVINIVLDLAFILVFGMGVTGAALATIIAQLVSGLMCLPYILKKGSVFRVTRSDFRLSASELTAHLRIGLPMGFQASIIAIGAIVLQFALNDLGMVAVAAFTAANRIDIIATLPLLSFGITMATYTAQNFGAKEYRRIRRGVLQCVVISVAYSLIVGAINVTCGRYFSSFFIDSSDAALDLAQRYLTITGSCYTILGLLFIFRYTLQGLGHSVVPTVAGVLELVMRLFAAIILTYHLGFLGVCAAGPLAWLGACLPLGIAFAVTIRRMVREQDLRLMTPQPDCRGVPLDGNRHLHEPRRSVEPPRGIESAQIPEPVVAGVSAASRDMSNCA